MPQPPQVPARLQIPSAGPIAAVVAGLTLLLTVGGFAWRAHRQASVVDELRACHCWAELKPALPETIRSRLPESWLKGLDRVSTVYLTPPPSVGSVPLELLTRVGQLPPIDRLDLGRGTTDDSLERLSGLVVREKIRFHESTRVTNAGLQHIARQKQLKELSLSNTRVSDEGLRHLAGLESLESLDLVATDVTGSGLEALAGLPRLKSLLLSTTSLTDEGLESLSRFPELMELGLYGNRITDDGLRHVARVAKLERLGLGGTRITDDGLPHLAGLPRLNFLNLDGTALTDKGIPHLCKFRDLKTCSMRQTAVTADGEAELLRAFPGCNPLR